MFRNYIKSRAGIIFVFAAFAGALAAITAGYSIPWEAFYYVMAIGAFLCLVYFAADFALFYRKTKNLRQCKKEITLTTQNLPEPKTEIEKEYSEMLEILFDEKMKNSKESEQKFYDLSDYYTIWAHQIKTPIAAARLILQSGEADEEELLEQIRRIEEYTQMAMCYARLSSDSTDFVIREISIDELVRDEIRNFSSQFIRKKLTLDVKTSGKTVVSDEKWLGFVIGQVLSNAVKYTNSGGIKIYFEEPETLCIKDTGMGIAPEDLPRIFEKGYTGLNGRIDEKSSGIGLYLCDKICGKLGHKITAESGKNGTAIKINLTRENVNFE